MKLILQTILPAFCLLLTLEAKAELHVYLNHPTGSLEMVCIKPIKKSEICQVAKLRGNSKLQSVMIDEKTAQKIFTTYAPQIEKYCSRLPTAHEKVELSWNLKDSKLKQLGALSITHGLKAKDCSMVLLGLESELVSLLK